MTKATTHRDAILATMITLSYTKPVDSETITVACFKAFPSLFSMDLFKEYPRMDRVTKRISDLMSDGYLLENNQGYTVTNKCKEWGVQNSELIRRARQLLTRTNLDVISSYNISSDEFEKEKRKLIRTSAYNKFKKDRKNITVMDFMDFLKLDIYSTRQLFERKVKRIKSLCSMDKELMELFSYMSGKYGEDYTSFKNHIDKLIG